MGGIAEPGAGAGPYEKEVGHEQMHCSKYNQG